MKEENFGIGTAGEYAAGNMGTDELDFEEFDFDELELLDDIEGEDVDYGLLAFDDVSTEQFTTVAIPEELKKRGQWVNWGHKFSNENKKIPYDPKTQNKANVTDPNSCSSFEDACGNEDCFTGIGFALFEEDPYVVIDIDDCIGQNGKVKEHALEIIEYLDSYTEISPSGRGIHIFIRAQKHSSRSRTDDIEIYDSKRYITVTGNLLSTKYDSINDRQDQLDALCEKFFGCTGSVSDHAQTVAAAPVESTVDDGALLEKAFSSANGDAIRALYEGRWEELGYPSQSEADLALCEHLAFWFGKDVGRIDQVFRMSGLYRPKWDQKRGPETYGNITLSKAVATVEAVYTQSDGIDWPEPRLSAMPKAVPFPVDALPVVISAFVADTAERLSVPPEYLAISSLVVMASMIGNRVVIMPKRYDYTWMERSCLWGFVVGGPGTKKTPALKQVCAPYDILQEELRQQYAQDYKKWLSADRKHQAARRAYEKKLNQYYEGAIKDEPELPSILENDLEAPVPSCLTLQDVTLERICQIMNNSPHLTLYRDELSGFFESLNKYNKAKDDRKFYLECYTGGAHIIERIGREGVYIKDRYLNMVGSIQPGVLNAFFKSGNDGFIERFALIAIPDHNSSAGYVDVEPDYKAINAYNELCRRLFYSDWSSIGLSASQDKLYVKYDESAQVVFNEWTLSNISKLSVASRIVGNLKKAPGLIARLSLVLHLVKVVSGEHTGDASRVSVATINSAIAIVDGYLEYMWHRLMFIVDGGDTSSGIGKKLLDYISDLPKDTFSIRDIKQKGWSGVYADEDVVSVLRGFVDMNWISGPHKYTPSEGGRSSVIYRINPKVRRM